MLNNFYLRIGGNSSVSVIVISVAIMLFSGFLMTRITKLLKLPNVTAYIIAGILIGPFCLDLIPSEISLGMDFISDVALCFIAFGVGEYFKIDKLKQNGTKVIVITLCEALFATVLVFILCYFVLNLGLAFSLVLGALASATAPASTMLTIRQTNAHGDFVDTLLSVVALDDVVSLVAFSIAVSVSSSGGESASVGEIVFPILYNLFLIMIGILFGILLKLLMARRSNDNRLIVSVAFLFCICGIGAVLSVSPLLGCMAMGMTYINTSGDEKLFKQLNYFSPPILLLFFVKSGLGFRIDALFSNTVSGVGVPLIVIGVSYFIVRIIGKYTGAFAGSMLVKKSKEVRNYLGLALIPQAGVAIGLSALGARILGGSMGEMLQTVILSSSILYELLGPTMAKLSLYLSKSYGEENTESPEIPKENGIDLLKQRLKDIQGEIEKKEYARSEEEYAFLEAIDDVPNNEYMRRKFINRRGK